MEQMLHRFESLGPQDRSEWFDEVRKVLVRHEAAEEQSVYPAVRERSGPEDQIVDERLAEQAETHDMIARLESVNSGSDEFRIGSLALRAAVLEHADHEEQTIFALIAGITTPDERAAMARRYERAKHGAPWPTGTSAR